jgi:hypothetical protein
VIFREHSRYVVIVCPLILFEVGLFVVVAVDLTFYVNDLDILLMSVAFFTVLVCFLCEVRSKFLKMECVFGEQSCTSGLKTISSH